MKQAAKQTEGSTVNLTKSYLNTFGHGQIKERPVLFSVPMVKAIRERRKTVTRRVIRESFNGCLTNGGPHPCPNDPIVIYPGETYESQCHPGESITVDHPEVRASFHCSTLDSVAKCPYGKPGDILWVREEHYRFGHWRRNGITKKGNPKWMFVAEDDDVRYFDSPPERFLVSRDKREPHIPRWYKRLGRFMPKSAYRTKLVIEAIGVEALHDITEEEAVREGIQFYDAEILGRRYRDYIADSSGYGDPNHDYPTVSSALESFRTLWIKVNGEDSWNQNCWVWVVNFKKL